MSHLIHHVLPYVVIFLAILGDSLPDIRLPASKSVALRPLCVLGDSRTHNLGDNLPNIFAADTRSDIVDFSYHLAIAHQSAPSFPDCLHFYPFMQAPQPAVIRFPSTIPTPIRP